MENITAKQIKKLNSSLLRCGVKYDVYEYDSYTLNGLLVQFFRALNECIDNVNTYNQMVVALKEWVEGEGLQIAVNNRIQELIDDGTLSNIINQELFSGLNCKVNFMYDKQMICNLLEFYDEKDGDDYSNAFQKAFDYLAENYDPVNMNPNNKLKAILYIPSGNWYKITRTIRIKSPVLVKGLSPWGVSKIYANWDGNNYFDMFEIIDTTHSARICFENVRFSNIPPTKSAIYFPSSFCNNGVLETGFGVDGYIQNCWFEGFGYNNVCGIRGSFANYIIDKNVFEHLNPCVEVNTHDGENRITNNTMYACYKGIILTGVGGDKKWLTQDTIISNNVFNYSPDDSVSGFFLKADNYHLITCVGNNLVARGSNRVDNFIVLNNCNDVVLTSNTADGVVHRGIYMDGCKNIEIVSCNIKTNLTTNPVTGFNILNSSYVKIFGGFVNNLGGVQLSNGVTMSGSNNILINGLSVEDTQFGVRAIENSKNIKITDCMFNVNNDEYGVDNTSEISVQINNEGVTEFNTTKEITEQPKKTVLFKVKEFSTANFKYIPKTGYITHNVINDSENSLKIYDGLNSIDLLTLTPNTNCVVTFAKGKWYVL